MKKFLIKIAGSLILVVVLALTLILSYPIVVLAQGTTPSTALELLEKGIQADESGDDNEAKRSYKKAIEQVLEDRDVEVFIVAKTRLANLEEKAGATRLVTKLREEAQAAEKSLGADTDGGGICGECPPDGYPAGTTGEFRSSGLLKRCVKCPSP
ncbi:hypothetical protein [Chroococcus sp. FPU101]|uniref:hypothetical protein n=1 Tax=Chroococcus sp. FPU101 TaxID=1974212 RepID=UPI001A8E4A78|nr:hypothetical protein [Chroococcus sp. FPU101]GFE69526.1 hypothetical protein CFPU101_21360 [Chroococcus sp. FPU101]